MHIGRRCCIREDYLVAFVYLDMLLVAVKRVSALLRPTGIHILMEFLVRIVIPQFVALALLYLRILLTSVALAWGNDKTGIYDPPLVELKALGLHERTEVFKQLVIRTDGREGFAILPDRLLVRYIIHVLYPQKSAETGAVHYLIFYLMVTQAIVALEKQYLEHQHTIYGRTPGIALTLACEQRGFQCRTEYLKVHQ